MLFRVLPALVLGLTAALTWAAIAFLPESLHFPVVEYSIPGNVQVAVYKSGESDQDSCKNSAGKFGNAIRANCPTCEVVERCFRGLSSEHRKILSQEPLSTPSLRMPGGKLVQTILAKDPQLALVVCLQIEQYTALNPADQRLRCFPALARR